MTRTYGLVSAVNFDDVISAEKNIWENTMSVLIGLSSLVAGMVLFVIILFGTSTTIQKVTPPGQYSGFFLLVLGLVFGVLLVKLGNLMATKKRATALAFGLAIASLFFFLLAWMNYPSNAYYRASEALSQWENIIYDFESDPFSSVDKNYSEKLKYFTTERAARQLELRTEEIRYFGPPKYYRDFLLTAMLGIAGCLSLLSSGIVYRYSRR